MLRHPYPSINMGSFVYITVWYAQRGDALLNLVISLVDLREDIQVRSYYIFPAGINSIANSHWNVSRSDKRLIDISGVIIGAIYVGRTAGFANDDKSLFDWMDENDDANNLNAGESLFLYGGLSFG